MAAETQVAERSPNRRRCCNSCRIQRERRCSAAASTQSQDAAQSCRGPAEAMKPDKRLRRSEFPGNTGTATVYRVPHPKFTMRLSISVKGETYSSQTQVSVSSNATATRPEQKGPRNCRENGSCSLRTVPMSAEQTQEGNLRIVACPSDCLSASFSRC